MIKNYFKIAWRNLVKNKVFSFINIFGLSLGLTCCMLIAMYIYNELNYDNYHKNGNRVYQLATTFIKDGEEDPSANTPAPMARMMQMEFPEIEKSTRLLRTFSDDKTLLQYTGPGNEIRSFNEKAGYIADSTFFQVLTYQFKEGNPVTALSEPNSLVISEDIAEKMFGNASALDKIVHISSSTNGDNDFKVTGVFSPSPAPTHIDARFFMSANGGDAESFFNRPDDLASNNMFFTYFLLKEGANEKNLENKFPAFMDRFAKERLDAMGFQKKQFLVPIKDIHLFSNTNSNVTPNGSLTYLYILGSIALFTLLIGCINFMNLSTARSSRRSAEVGVRKVLGAERGALIRQFLGESILFSLIAFFFALVAGWLLLPVFSSIAGKQLVFSFAQHGPMLALFLLLAVITGIIAGSYPAFYLSSFKPVRVLKGKIANSLAAVSFRKALVVFQFVISAGLIIASVIINEQMQYIRTKDLGFEKEQQVVIPLRSESAKNSYTAFKAAISRSSSFVNAGASMFYPGIFNPSDMPLYREGENMNAAKKVFMNWIDGSFLQTLGIKPVAGRLFSNDFPADTSYRMILNEKAIKEMGFTNAAEAIGKDVLIDWQDSTYSWEIIGVVKDFHFMDLHSEIKPYGFQLNNLPQYNYFIAHGKPGNIPGMLETLRQSWQQLNPNEPFEYSFLDDDFQKNYESDSRLFAMVRYFTILAILISCLGLFGLSTFSAERRTKEIGIRKVLGAGTRNIIGLLSKEFLTLVVIAIVIASPLAWWAMNKWLQDFAYKTTITWEIFAITAGIAICIAVLTISFQAIKAALANPVKSLRTE
jgi:putative ABC transport system permease protein